MSDFAITRIYPHPLPLVWHVLTDPELVAQWTTTGRGGRPEGFRPVTGTKFRFVAKPAPGWRGIVDCVVQEVDPPRLLRYTWAGDDEEKPTLVTYRLRSEGDGTRFTWEHTGFTGVGGFFMSRLLGSVRRKMLTVALPPVLDAVASGDERS